VDRVRGGSSPWRIEFKEGLRLPETRTSVGPWDQATLEAFSRSLEASETDREAQSRAVLRWAAEQFGPRVSLACSFGAEDCLLVDLLAAVAPDVPAFYLDTGLLFAETLTTRDRLMERYGTAFRRVAPALTVQEQSDVHGPALWSREPDRCCQIRKVEPLKDALSGLDCWITGVRRDQSPTRAGAGLIEWDGKFGLVKCNPLAAWSSDDVWGHIRSRNVPYNPMHDRGYPSIGCWPCTRAVLPGEDPRAGRWSGFQKTECGLHQ
jgi:phosphoadenosine phosphosulfate reductase